MSSLAQTLERRTDRPRPLVAEPAGTPAAVVAAAERAATAWRLPAPRLLRLGMNGVFACGTDIVLRVGRPSADPDATIRTAERARAAGVATPHAVCEVAIDCGDGLWATAWERVHPVGAPADWQAVGRMVAALHALPPPDDAAVLPWCGDFPWWQFEEVAPPILAELDAAAAAGLQAALDTHDGWEATARVGDLVICHGDVHPGNVVMTATGPVLLDWDLTCIGPPAWDHAALMTWSQRWGGEPGVYEAFAAGYGHSMCSDPLARSLATLRLVSATLMRIRAGSTDPDAAAEAAQRLRWWRGDPAAPQWTAQ